ncbi:MAG: hydantoinase/oxoprolinase N-terminal domain-containing protein, partial [Nitriliruptoraceae bacterium]
MTNDHLAEGATLAVDVGGTFTDVVRWDGTHLTVAKTSSTPDQADGVIAGATRLTGPTVRLLHGTTVATNALLQRRGAATALVTDAGFEDLLEIGRQDRPSLYDPFADRPEPLVARSRRFGVDPDADPSQVVDRIAAAVEAGAPTGVEAVAVCLLDAWSDGTAE